MRSIRIIASSVALAVALGQSTALARCVTAETPVMAIGGKTNNQLFAVSGVSSSDAWAVGETSNSSSAHPLIEHFDGSRWTIVAGPKQKAVLTGVTALASNDVWAVGTSGAQPYAIHWDGTAWNVIPTPRVPPGYFAYINAVSGFPGSPNDVWAVGQLLHNSGRSAGALTEHWDGHVWTSGSGPGALLNAVSVTAAGEVWAVGSDNTYPPRVPFTVIGHWENGGWSTRAGAFGRGDLNGVAAESGGDVWVAGLNATCCGPPTPAIEHFDGKKWTIVSSPNPGPEATFTSVAASSKTDAWAVGVFSPQSSTNVQLTFLEHWDGVAWTIVPAPSSDVFTDPGLLLDVSGTVLNVGWSDGDSTYEQLFARPVAFSAHC